MAFILFSGGIRSGKSRIAEIWGEGASPERLLVSTSIAPASPNISRTGKTDSWRLITDPLEPLNRLKIFQEENPAFAGSVIIDSIGAWIGNLMAQNLSGNDILRRVSHASRTLKTFALPCGVVSDEAGLTPPPAVSVSRKFVDLLGLANQILARDSHCAIMVIAGLPVLLKGSMPAILDRVTRGYGN